MFNDFEELKKVLVNIVNNSFVTLGKPVLISNTNVFIRDSMLLAPQGHKSLESVGSLYGGDFKKVDIAKNLTEDQKDELTKDLTKEQKENLNLNQYIKENMDLLLKVNKKLPSFRQDELNCEMLFLRITCCLILANAAFDRRDESAALAASVISGRRDGRDEMTAPRSRDTRR